MLGVFLNVPPDLLLVMSRFTAIFDLGRTGTQLQLFSLRHLHEKCQLRHSEAVFCIRPAVKMKPYELLPNNEPTPTQPRQFEKKRSRSQADNYRVYFQTAIICGNRCRSYLVDCIPPNVLPRVFEPHDFLLSRLLTVGWQQILGRSCARICRVNDMQIFRKNNGKIFPSVGWH